MLPRSAVGTLLSTSTTSRDQPHLLRAWETTKGLCLLVAEVALPGRAETAKVCNLTTVSKSRVARHRITTLKLIKILGIALSIQNRDRFINKCLLSKSVPEPSSTQLSSKTNKDSKPPTEATTLTIC